MLGHQAPFTRALFCRCEFRRRFVPLYVTICLIYLISCLSGKLSIPRTDTAICRYQVMHGGPRGTKIILPVHRLISIRIQARMLDSRLRYFGGFGRSSGRLRSLNYSYSAFYSRWLRRFFIMSNLDHGGRSRFASWFLRDVVFRCRLGRQSCTGRGGYENSLSGCIFR